MNSIEPIHSAPVAAPAPLVPNAVYTADETGRYRPVVEPAHRASTWCRDHPETVWASGVSTLLTLSPTVATAVDAGLAWGAVGTFVAVAGVGAVPFALKSKEAPTAVALGGAGAFLWGVYTSWASWFPSVSSLAVGAMLTAVSGAAGLAVAWRRGGTPIERTQLDHERARLAIELSKLRVQEEREHGPHGPGGGIEDPWAPIPSYPWAPSATVGTLDPIRIGPDVVIPLTGGHIMIAGRTNAGKSGVLACLIADLLPRENVRVTVIDPKGDVVLQTMRNTNVVLVDADGAEGVMAERVATMERRGVLRGDLSERYMNEGGDTPEDVWSPTVAEPWDVVIVDEFTDFAGAVVMDHVDAVARKGRANGLTIVLCTQSVGADLFRTKKSSTGGGLRSQFGTLVALGLATPSESDKVFGQGLAAAGWDASKLPDEPGHMLIKSPGNLSPVVRRAPYLSLPTFADTVRTHAKGAVPQGPLRKALSAPVAPAAPDVDSEPVLFASAPQTDAQAPRGTVRDRVTAYLSEHGQGKPSEIAAATGDDRDTVKAELPKMRKVGIAESNGGGVWTLVREQSNVIEFRRR